MKRLDIFYIFLVFLFVATQILPGELFNLGILVLLVFLPIAFFKGFKGIGESTDENVDGGEENITLFLFFSGMLVMCARRWYSIFADESVLLSTSYFNLTILVFQSVLSPLPTLFFWRRLLPKKMPPMDRLGPREVEND